MNCKDLAQTVIDSCIPKLHRNGEICKPYVICISGSRPALGKSTLADEIQRILGDEQCSVVEMDNWIQESREYRLRNRVAGINLGVYNEDQITKSLETLILDGQPISMPVYDHKLGKPRSEEIKIQPRSIICLVGAISICPRFWPYKNYLLCLKARTPEDARDMTIRRNVTVRGYDEQDAIRDYEYTEEEYLRHVEPNIKHADVVVLVDKSYAYEADFGLTKDRDLKRNVSSRYRQAC